ncbi:YceI family protein [Albidovulum sp.]|jgi:polyisoprenoid-binding protein YceI|uniref:YceI family protein n=1 Tax=Albidovulum sp. TaxID=1872424 RepID=UPI003030DD96
MRRRSVLATILILGLASPVAAAPVAYAYDAEGSSVTAEADYGAVAVRARMPVASASFTIDFDRVANSRFAVTLRADRARSNLPFAASAIMGESVLDAANHPEIGFESSRVAATGAGRLAVTGRATIRGVTREVTLQAVIFRPRGSAPGHRDDLKVLITGTISRAAFGAAGHAESVGDTVRLRLLLHLRRAAG